MTSLSCDLTEGVSLRFHGDYSHHDFVRGSLSSRRPRNERGLVFKGADVGQKGTRWLWKELVDVVMEGNEALRILASSNTGDVALPPLWGPCLDLRLGWDLLRLGRDPFLCGRVPLSKTLEPGTAPEGA